jgi:monoterpene epsilon-lactone hydrolase
VLVSYNGYLSRAARLYANGRDLKDPYLSPIYGDFNHFPPTVLASGTRDLLLSLTVLAHRKLRRANVEAELHVFEGMSYIHYVLISNETAKPRATALNFHIRNSIL